jgi:hypothetical protein
MFSIRQCRKESESVKFGASLPAGKIMNAAELAPWRKASAAASTAQALKRGFIMRTYYFDLRDGLPTRDRKGIEFSTAAAAIEHSKELERRLRNERRLRDPDLVVIVIDESGSEVHRELVHADTESQRPDSNG